MGELTGNNAGTAAQASTPKNTRILIILAIFGVLGSIISAAFVSLRFGIGLIFGTAIAFLNYFWLRRSLLKAFDFSGGFERPRLAGSGYFIRYLVIGGIIAIVYLLNLMPIAAVLLGSAGFAFALVADGIIRMAAAIFSGPER